MRAPAGGGSSARARAGAALGCRGGAGANRRGGGIDRDRAGGHVEQPGGQGRRLPQLRPALGRDARLLGRQLFRPGYAAASQLRAARLLLDRRRQLSTRKKRFAVPIRASQLHGGRHLITVTAQDSAGNRRTRSLQFTRCSGHAQS